MNKLTEIKSVPIFVNKYCNSEKMKHLELNTKLFNFTQDILFKECIIEDDKITILNVNLDKQFIDFYLDKSKLDRYYNCIYENETGIPKSVSNECFKIVINGYEKSVIIEKYSENKLYLLCVD